jgi:hypothetical protein
VPLLRAQAELQCKADTTLHVTACLAHLVQAAGQPSGTVSHVREPRPLRRPVRLASRLYRDMGPWEVCAR